MFKEEEVIDGVLHSRSSPKSEFKPLTPVQLTNKILRLKAAIEKLSVL